MFTFPANAEFILLLFFFNLLPSVTFRVVKHIKTVGLNYILKHTLIFNTLLL